MAAKNSIAGNSELTPGEIDCFINEANIIHMFVTYAVICSETLFLNLKLQLHIPVKFQCVWFVAGVEKKMAIVNVISWKKKWHMCFK